MSLPIPTPAQKRAFMRVVRERPRPLWEIGTAAALDRAVLWEIWAMGRKAGVIDGRGLGSESEIFEVRKS